MNTHKKLDSQEANAIFELLKMRFEKDRERFHNLSWPDIRLRFEKNPGKLWTIHEMEKSGGEPNLLEFDQGKGLYIFCDFSKESPKNRRSLCYDRAALESRRKNKPTGSVEEMAFQMGVEVMNETEYRKLQSISEFDTKTSSWLKTPESIRKLGGAIFGDFRYNQVFIYHNGAESYYAARGFRAILTL